MRLATFNLKHGETIDGHTVKPEVVAEACAELKADILALQEVDRGHIRPARENLASLAAEASGMKVAFIRNRQSRICRYGNALLVRGEIEEAGLLDLGGKKIRLRVKGLQSQINDDRRSALLARIRVEDKPVTVAATHLAPRMDLITASMSKITDTLEGWPEPQILMGDFNASKDIITSYDEEFIVLADVPLTLPADKPKRWADHIAVKGLSLQAAETKHFEFSDHLALVVEASWL